MISMKKFISWAHPYHQEFNLIACILYIYISLFMNPPKNPKPLTPYYRLRLLVGGGRTQYTTRQTGTLVWLQKAPRAPGEGETVGGLGFRAQGFRV